MKKGFTLVELSIVLVIIGLLVGGILVGQSLISSAKISGVIREQSQYVAAIRLFHAQFKGLPGDSSFASSSLGVGNGNSDGAIAWQNEHYWAWRQLSLSRFIKNDAQTADGHYTGAHVGGAVSKNINAPASKTFKDAVWFLNGAPFLWKLRYDGGANDPHFFKSHIRLAGDNLGDGGTKYPEPWNGPLTVEQVISIDSKMDDGKPGLGEVMVHTGTNDPSIYDCVTTNVSATAEYDFTQEGNVCHVVFWLPDF